MEVLLILVLTLINGVFAMSEMALSASRRLRLVALAEEGEHGAHAALKLMDEPTRFLSTVQVGITSIGMLNGIVGEAAFSADLGDWFKQLGLSENVAAISATALVVTVITFITIIFGELVPKRIGQLYPETVARWVAGPMAWLSRAASPFVKLLTTTTQGVLKLLRINTKATNAVTEEEITASLDEGLDAGLMEHHERQMVHNVFGLDDRSLPSLMIPREDIRWVDASRTAAQALDYARAQHRAGGQGGPSSRTHSWYPVCRGGLDEVLGIVSLGRLLQSDATTPVGGLAEPAVFVPETLSALELLEQFRARANRVVFVVDEYGVVQGLVTPADLLEAITGELKPRIQGDAWATRRDDGAWQLDALMPVAELKARLGLDELPQEDKGRYNTLAGLLMAVMGRLPSVGDRVGLEGWTFEVETLEGRRAERVVARRAPTAPTADAAAPAAPAGPAAKSSP